MTHFLKKIFLFSFYCLLLTTALFIGYILKYGITLGDIPAPPLSDSFSLNEKLEFIRKTKKNEKIISLGSSICLNNIHSETIIRSFHSNSYLNASSWGMTMEDNYQLLKTLCKIHIPTTLIVASSITEFQLPPKKINYSALDNYLMSSDLTSSLYHGQYFNLRYYIENIKYAKKVRSCKNEYEYLLFDQYGGVNLDETNFKIDKKRWNADFECGKIIYNNYSYLDSISAFCKYNNITLLFFQSPFRSELYSNFDSNKLNELTIHINKIENILTRDKHTFINTNDTLWNDNLFVDGEHLNAAGAKLFTEYCFDKTNSKK